MATDFLVVSQGGATVADASSRFIGPDMDLSLANTTEGVATWNNAWTAPISYTASKAGCRITQNDDAAGGTFRTRKNGAAGSQTVAITANTTGIFKDTTHTDSLVAGDEYGYEMLATTTGGAHTITWRLCWSLLTPSGNEAPVIIHAGTSPTASTVDNYFQIQGRVVAGRTVETDSDWTARTACTYDNLNVVVSANTTTAATVTLRKNHVSSALSAAYTSGQTGAHTDTGPETVAAGDELTTYLDITSGASITVRLVSYTSDGAKPNTCSDTTGFTQWTATEYFGLVGSLQQFDPTESNVQVEIPIAGLHYKNLYASIISNNHNAASTIALRSNGSNVISLVVTASTTGVFEETTTQFDPASGDNVCFGFIWTAGTGLVSPGLIGIEQIPTPVAETELIGRPYGHVGQTQMSQLLAL